VLALARDLEPGLFQRPDDIEVIHSGDSDQG
jgi:hypothetical protein